MRMAVVGHVEWIDLLRVDRLPTAGEVATATGSLQLAAGSGAIAASQLAKLGCEVTFYTRLTNDDLGERARAEMEQHGIRVEAVSSGTGLRRAVVFVDATGERTITVWGAKRVPAERDPLPWTELAAMDGVCFLAGDGNALRAARAAPILVSTARWLATLRRSGVRLDALVGSRLDPAEQYTNRDLVPPPKLVVITDGNKGGTIEDADGREERYDPVGLVSDSGDAYGCGDSFIAGLAWALSRGDAAADAVVFAARCGAACRSGSGLDGQMRLSDATP